MANQQDWTVWKQRWDALDKTIDSYYQRLPELEPPVPRKETLQCLVRCLQAFAKGQFDFFFDGFGKQVQYKLKEDPNYPSAHVLWVILDQIAHDLEVIQRAVNQRVSGSKNKKMRETLDKADKLAWNALQPVVGEGKLVKDKKTTVITYFQKSPNIRVIPYAPVALIGIPFTCIDVSRDYLATPHEVGHYVFRHGKIGEGRIHATLLREVPKDPAWCYRWVEEIFADVYGCLIAGPLIALDFQDLLLEKSLEKFTKDDGEHPVPVLRPYIYTKVLEKKMGLQNWSVKLNNHWDERLAERGNPTTFTLDESTMPGSIVSSIIYALLRRHKVQLVDARKAVNEIVETVYNLLKAANIQSDWWRGYLKSSTTVDTLYDAFGAHLLDPSMLPDAPPPLEPCETDTLWETWKSELWETLESKLSEEEKMKVQIEIQGGEVRESFWVNVLRADGWATKGPHGVR